MIERIYSFLGLAAKAGKLISGDEACERALKSRKVYLVIVAQDASSNTRKKFIDMCGYRDIGIVIFGEKEHLGKHTGKTDRSVIVITGKSFASHLKEMIENHRTVQGGV